MYSISIALGVNSIALGDNSKACGDKTDGKKTFNHTAGKVWGYR
jgi:hypothetical protein